MINFKDIPKDIIQQLDKSLQTIINQDKEIAKLKAELKSIHHTWDCPCNSCFEMKNEESNYNSWWGIPDED